MRKSVNYFFVVAGVCLLFAAPAQAEHIFGPEDLDTTYGATFRLRQEIWDKIFDLDTLTTPPASNTITQNRNFMRLRTHLWGNFDYDKVAALKISLTNEMKYYFDVSNFKPTPNSYFDEDELIFEDLYLDLNLNKLMSIPVSLRLGRQNFFSTFGEGFLVREGTPGDGSRTFYFNAFKANIKFNDNNNLDLVYISDPQKDVYLPSLHAGTKKVLNTSNEQGVVVYSRNKLSPSFTIEPYYIWKQEDPFNTNPKLNLHTFGAHGVFAADGWRMSAELAYQTGEYNGGRDREGWGGYLFVSKSYENVMWKPTFDIAYMFLSGDNPNTAKNEGWDPLFDRASFLGPLRSELYVYTLVPETSAFSATPGYWTNLKLLGANMKLNFTPATNLFLSYNALWSEKKTKITGTNAPMFSNNSTDRGHLLIAHLNQTIAKKLDALVRIEYFVPGNFYSSAAKEAVFFRWELQFKI